MHRKSLAAPLILIGLGGIFLADNLIPDFDIYRWWPLALIAVGVGLLIERLR